MDSELRRRLSRGSEGGLEAPKAATERNLRQDPIARMTRWKPGGRTPVNVSHAEDFFGIISTPRSLKMSARGTREEVYRSQISMDGKRGL